MVALLQHFNGCTAPLLNVVNGHLGHCSPDMTRAVNVSMRGVLLPFVAFAVSVFIAGAEAEDLGTCYHHLDPDTVS